MQAIEFFVFATLMFLDIIVLAVLAFFFKYRDEEEEEPKPVNQKLLNKKLDAAVGKTNSALEMSEMNASAQQRATAAVPAFGKKSDQL